MKKKIFTATFLIITLIISCTPKPPKIIAIDVLLTPSEEMRTQALHLNSLINQNNPETIRLDENHIPHITLLQCFVDEKDLPRLKEALMNLYGTIKNDALRAEDLSYSKDSEESFAMIAIEKSEPLQKLHEKIVALIKPYILKKGFQESFVQNPAGSPISESTITYIPDFVENYSYENYSPHISLGVARKVFLDSLAQHVFKPIPFKAASISVYQLGDHGTAQELIWKSK